MTTEAADVSVRVVSYVRNCSASSVHAVDRQLLQPLRALLRPLVAHRTSARCCSASHTCHVLASRAFIVGGDYSALSARLGLTIVDGIEASSGKSSFRNRPHGRRPMKKERLRHREELIVSRRLRAVSPVAGKGHSIRIASSNESLL